MIRLRALAVVLALLTLGGVASTYSAFTDSTANSANAVQTGSSPRALADPAISGTPLEGELLTLDPGSWPAQTELSYRWERCATATDNCETIAGETALTYRLAAADVGKRVRASVSGRGSSGFSSTTQAEPLGPVQPASYGGAVLAHQPAAYYRLGEASGTSARNEVVGSPDASYTGAHTLAANGIDPPDTAVDYAGGYAQAGDHAMLDVTGAFAVEAWVNLENTEDQALVEKYGGVDASGAQTDTFGGYGLWVANGKFTGYAADTSNGATVTSTSGASAGRWYHLVATSDGSAFRLYVNGQLDASQSTNVTPTDSAAALRLARSSGSARGNLAGRLDEVAIYDHALSAAHANDHYARARPKPEAITPPSLSGSARQGQTLTADPGGWDGDPSSFAYEWLRCDAQGNGCTTIAAVGGQTYTLAAADVERTIRVNVTATGTNGSGTATSAQTAVVLPLAPSATTTPSVAGQAKRGSTLTGADGSWANNPTSYARQWLRCDSAGNNCNPIAGASSQTYTLSGADVAATIRYRVTAINSGGSTAATSGPTALVTETYAQSVGDDAPRSWWRFEQPTGTANWNDSGANSITLSVRSGTAGDGGGAVAASPRSIYLNGSTYLQAGDNYDFANRAPFSVEFWVAPTQASAPGWRRLVEKVSGTNTPSRSGWSTNIGCSCDGSDRRVTFERWNNNNWEGVLSSSLVQAGNWQHVVATYDGSTVRTYWNGTLEASSASTQNIPDTGAQLTVGRITDINDHYFQGYLDELAIYNSALSASRVRAHWNARTN